MIVLHDKKDCCGCTACQQICPHRSIEMREDNEGFLYPVTDAETCTDCHLCEKVCPVINRFASQPQPDSYGARTDDEELRSASSSGGAFTILATWIIEQGGVVFGARFDDDWSVVHDYAETVEGLAAFRGSKYVQSRLGDTYSKVRSFLKDGRMVLFTGTPCQVSGLNHFLIKKYDNLYTMDMVCHSISSPKVWRLYLKNIKGDNSITRITFRDKNSYGWRNYGLLVEGETPDKEYIELAKGGHAGRAANVYMRGFLTDITTRPSCSACPARNYTSGSDIMLADFWHLDLYHPNWDDNKGMSEILAVTDKGRTLLDSVHGRMFCESIPYSEVEDKALHSPITMSCKPNRYRTEFFKKLGENNIEALLDKYTRRSDRITNTIEFIKWLYRVSGLIKIKQACWKTRTR